MMENKKCLKLSKGTKRFISWLGRSKDEVVFFPLIIIYSWIFEGSISSKTSENIIIFITDILDHFIIFLKTAHIQMFEANSPSHSVSD